jgi:chromate reductase
MKIFCFAGSTRTGSWNKKLLRVAEGELVKLGADIDHLELTAQTAPVFDDDLVQANRIPASVLDAKERIRRADGVLICSPEYNYSIPGPLKNFIDWLSRPPKDNPLRGKTCAQLGATPGPGGTLQAQAAIRQVLTAGVEAWVVPGAAFTISRVDEAFDDSGDLKDAKQLERLRSYLEKLIRAPGLGR